MLTRTIRKSILDIRITPSALPPTFLLPYRARYFNSTTQHVEPPTDGFNASEVTSTSPDNAQEIASSSSSTSSTSPLSSTPSPATISPSITELLPHLAAQPSHYISAHIHGRPYLVTAGDIVRLPFRMPGVMPGDVLRLNRASSLGSRDYTLKGAPYLDERIFECRARVMGTESEPLRLKEKTKRRNRKINIVKSKHKFTILRISELKINDSESIES